MIWTLPIDNFKVSTQNWETCQTYQTLFASAKSISPSLRPKSRFNRIQQIFINGFTLQFAGRCRLGRINQRKISVKKRVLLHASITDHFRIIRIRWRCLAQMLNISKIPKLMHVLIKLLRNTTLLWCQSSHMTHWTISSGFVSSGSGYGFSQVQYFPIKLWL